MYTLHVPVKHVTLYVNSLIYIAHRGKTITKCCLSQVNGNFYIGTECGNVFVLDLMTFALSTEVIYWNKATTL